MSFAWRVAREALSGALLGAFFLGIGCRIVMRLLANLIDRAGEFSIGGSLEIAAYGAMVGALAGAAYALCRPVMPGRW